ncbi:MAG: DUF2202 domain-containing protein [Enhygromyxa sp.]
MATDKLLPTLLLSFALLPLAACDAAEELDAADASLSEAEIETLKWMREEEKLARDVYLTLGQTWDDALFVNVPKSEQKHMDALAKLLDRYGLEDPVVDESIGVFVDPALAELYVELTTAGVVSQEAALQVGAAIEELDMVDLQAAIDETDEPALIGTYESLLCGSRNHLRGFYAALTQIDVVYEAQYLDEATFFAILEGAHEQCG